MGWDNKWDKVQGQLVWCLAVGHVLSHYLQACLGQQKKHQESVQFSLVSSFSTFSENQLHQHFRSAPVLKLFVAHHPLGSPNSLPSPVYLVREWLVVMSWYCCGRAEWALFPFMFGGMTWLFVYPLASGFHQMSTCDSTNTPIIGTY